MARVELNIVALGDFKSVNAQIANLKTQVDLLNKSLVGTGMSANLAKDLGAASAAFKATMLSSGQFTATTVKMTNETAKFGAALASGKLKLSEYFNIITRKSGESAAAMRALALEQAKLQSSVIMSDPTKRGMWSVLTPTSIDKVTAATKIATAQQNLYNIAVKQGSTALINWGKNTQWAGRQLTVGLTMPLVMFGAVAAKTFKDVNVELTRMIKVYGDGVALPTQKALDTIKKEATALTKELASSMGIAAKDTAASAADLAATGLQGIDLIDATREAMRLVKLGELERGAAIETVISLQNVYKLSTIELTNAINFLNAVENQTSTSLADLTAGIPRVGPIVQQLGGDFKDTAAMMVAMKEAGVPAAQAANAIKSALASIINPTKQARDMFAQYNIDITKMATLTGGNPVEMLFLLQKSLSELKPLAQTQLIEQLFGKYQQARVQALLANLGQVGSQTKVVFDLMAASNQELAKISASEMKIVAESTTGKYQRAMESFKATIVPVGEKFIEVATILLEFGNAVGKAFSNLPGPVKSILGVLAGVGALAGPIIMLTGLFANFAGYILKGVFNLRALVTGTKTLGQLLTPEMIAATHASKVFGDTMLKDVSEVELLNKAIMNLTISMERMVGVMNMSAGGRFIGKAPGVKGFATGTDGIQGTDTIPAMLSPGEAVIPAKVVSQNPRLITSLVSGQPVLYAETGHVPDEIIADATKIQPGAVRYGKNGNIIPELQRTHFMTGDAGVMGLGRSSFNQAIKSSAGGVTGYQAAVELQFMRQNNFHIALAEQIAKKVGSNTAEAIAAVDKAFTKSIVEFSQNPGKMYGGRSGVSLESITERHLRPELAKVETAMVNKKSGRSLNLNEVFKALKTNRSGPSAHSTASFNPNIVHKDTGVALGKLGNMEKLATTGSGGAATKLALAEARGLNMAYLPEAMALRLKNANDAAAKAEAKLATATEKNLVQRTATYNEKVKAQQIAQQEFAERAAGRYGATASMSAQQVAMSRAAGIDMAAMGSSAMMMGLMGGSKGGAPGTGGTPPPNTGTQKSGMGMGTKMGLGMGLMMGGTAASQIGGGENEIAKAAGSAMTLASMALFIPGIGPQLAVVTALSSLAYSGIKHLMDAEKEHQAVVTASFKASKEAVDIFGGSLVSQTATIHHFAQEVKQTDPEIKKLKENIEAIQALDPKESGLRKVADSLKGMTGSAVIGTMRQFAAANVANGMDPAKVEDMIRAMLTYAGQTEYLKRALSEIPNSTKDATTATETWIRKLEQAAKGQEVNGYTYEGLTNRQKDYADGMLQVINRVMDTNTSWQTATQLAQGLTSSVKDTAEAYDLLSRAARNVGDFETSALLDKYKSMGLNLNAAQFLLRYQQNNVIPKNATAEDYKKIATDPKIIEKVILDSEAARKASFQAQKNYDTQVKVANTLQEQLKAAEKILKAEQERIALAKAEMEWKATRTELENKMRMQRASGDFLGAELTQQEIAAKSYEYNQATTKTAAEMQVEKIQLLIEAQNANVNAAQNALNKTADAIAKFKPLSAQEIKDIVVAIVKGNSSTDKFVQGTAGGALAVQSDPNLKADTLLFGSGTDFNNMTGTIWRSKKMEKDRTREAEYAAGNMKWATGTTFAVDHDGKRYYYVVKSGAKYNADGTLKEHADVVRWHDEETLTGGSAGDPRSRKKPKAHGGGVNKGETYLIGEKGMELWEAPASGRIIPNYNIPSYINGLQQSMSGLAQNVSNTTNGGVTNVTIYAENKSAREIAMEINALSARTSGANGSVSIVGSMQ